MSSTLVKLENVCKSFPLGNGASLEVLKNINLLVEEGESIAIMGPSGCGKSSLLNVIGTLDSVDSGVVQIDGESLQGGSADFFAEMRRGKIGFVFQKHHLLPQLTAFENILLPTLKSKDDFTVKALELLEKVGLTDRKDHRPGQLSGGECQRVALCRALINSPKLLLADEPTGALDSQAAGVLSKLLLKLNEDEGLTIITVTHSAEFAGNMAKTYKLSDCSLKEV
ncbi:MAG: ABC transporter ATP-binding protein [Lentisphaerales bacterium]|nr:ABC transporter ATP-binding protein [Lentisphaerales bacterium]